MSKASYTIYGGAWGLLAASARPVYRFNIRPADSGSNVGFRAVEEVMCMVRGGAWYDFATLARAADRDYFPIVERCDLVGFRTVEETLNRGDQD